MFVCVGLLGNGVFRRIYDSPRAPGFSIEHRTNANIYYLLNNRLGCWFSSCFAFAGTFVLYRPFGMTLFAI